MEEKRRELSPTHLIGRIHIRPDHTIQIRPDPARYPHSYTTRDTKPFSGAKQWFNQVLSLIINLINPEF